MNDPILTIGRHPRLLARMEREVRRGEPGACWPWTGQRDQDGYGKISFRVPGDRFFLRPHRVAYFLANDALPEPPLVVRHTCGTRLCCNDAHLEPGTVRENDKDTVRMGRKARGEQNGNSRLSAEQAEAIVVLRSHGFSQDKVGRVFGVTKRTVRLVEKGVVWAHVSTPEERAAIQNLRPGPKPAYQPEPWQVPQPPARRHSLRDYELDPPYQPKPDVPP